MRGIYEPTSFDLAGLQGAVDAADAAGGGTVWLGPGDYNIGTGTLKVGKVPTQHHVNIKGINPNTTRILCDTSAGGPALYLNLEKYVLLEGFSVVNQGARGGYGIQFGGDLGAGMQSNGINCRMVSVSGFDYGMDTSGGLGTSSDILFDHCVFSNCKNGFFTANFNALDYLLLMPEFWNNDVGCFVATGNVQVIHGCGEMNGTDFYLAGGNDATVRIQGFRSESPSGTWLVSMANNYVSVEDCIIHPRTAGVEVINTLAGINVKNSVLNGYITAHVFQDSAIVLDGVTVNTPGTDWALTNQQSSAYPPYGPGFRMTNNQGPVTNSRASIRNVYEAATGQMYPDVNCTFGVRPNDNLRVALVS